MKYVITVKASNGYRALPNSVSEHDIQLMLAHVFQEHESDLAGRFTIIDFNPLKVEFHRDWDEDSRFIEPLMEDGTDRNRAVVQRLVKELQTVHGEKSPLPTPMVVLLDTLQEVILENYEITSDSPRVAVRFMPFALPVRVESRHGSFSLMDAENNYIGSAGSFNEDQREYLVKALNAYQGD